MLDETVVYDAFPALDVGRIHIVPPLLNSGSFRTQRSSYPKQVATSIRKP